MSLDWGAAGSALAGLGFALIVGGLVVQTVAGASIRSRARLEKAGGMVLGGGFFLISGLIPTLAGSPVAALVLAGSTAALLASLYWENRLTKTLARFACAALLGLHFYDAWRDGELMKSLVVLGVVVGGLLALAAILRIQDKLKSKPRRDAHA